MPDIGQLYLRTSADGDLSLVGEAPDRVAFSIQLLTEMIRPGQVHTDVTGYGTLLLKVLPEPLEYRPVAFDAFGAAVICERVIALEKFYAEREDGWVT